MENWLRSNNLPVPNIDEYEFTFESFLDRSANIEADVSWPPPLGVLENAAWDLSLTQFT